MKSNMEILYKNKYGCKSVYPGLIYNKTLSTKENLCSLEKLLIWGLGQGQYKKDLEHLSAES